jgi:serine/threonine protein kinase
MLPSPSVPDDDLDDLYSHEAGSEPIPGYKLLHPLGRGGFGEVWKCEAPGGLHKAIKFVQGGMHALDRNAPADEELRAIQRVKAIRHPFILSMERVEVVAGELVIVLELADRNLADLLQVEQKAGRTGIAREPLLAYLREAAEALDLMNVRYELQHLDIKPQNLFLMSNHVKVGDFGLVNSLSAGQGGLSLGAITPLYASPEVFQGTISPHSDQYSLAIVFQELLTGTLPFKGKNVRQLLMQHSQSEPDLLPLPAGDREVVGRALAKDPHKRFPSCSDFVQALLAGLTEVVSATIPASPEGNGAEDGTRRVPSARTVKVRSGVRPPSSLLGDRPSDLTIGDLLSRTPHSEVWSAETSDGSPRLVKVLFGGAGGDGVARLAALRHPSLAPLEVLHRSPGRLVLSSAPGDRNLRDVLLECQSQGRPGIPRAQLLAYLKTAAEVLRFLAQQELYHLGLNPRALLLDGERLLLGDFGLAQLVWLPAGQPPAALNPRYSAPELQSTAPPRPGEPDLHLTHACDQYSLALIYHELLTGTYPVPAAADKPGNGRKAEGPPVLDRLPQAEREIVARALHPHPRLRWDSALEWVEALFQVGPTSADSAGLAEQENSGPDPRLTARPSPKRPTQRLFAQPAHEVLQTRFGTSLTANVIRQRLDGFRQQWQGEVLLDESRKLVFHMQTPRNLWQRWTGKQPGLEVRLYIGAPEMQAPAGVMTRTEVRMDLCPSSCTREQGSDLLKAMGPLLVESVRTHLRQNPCGRTQERVVWHHPLQLCPLLPDGTEGAPIECQGKDISLNGIGFYLPGQLPASHVILHLPQTAQTQQMSVQARIVRVQGCGDGWYEVGAVLLPPDQLPEDEALDGSAPRA